MVLYLSWYTIKYDGHVAAADETRAGCLFPNRGRRRACAGVAEGPLPLVDDRKRIGEDLKAVEYGWPVGMPLCRPMSGGLFEVRTSLAQRRIARVMFYVDREGRMVLLHGFIKKSQRTPAEDLELSRRNMKKHQKGMP